MLSVGPEASKTLQLLGYLQHNQIEIPEIGYNKFSGYKYPLLDDILEAIRPQLKEYNCIVVWSELQHTHERFEQPSDKGDIDNYLFTDSLVLCRILNIDNSQDYIECTSHGAGLNKNADKTLKAETIARRFSLMMLLGMQKLKAEDTDASEYDFRASSKVSHSTASEEMGGAARSFKNRLKSTAARSFKNRLRSTADKRNNESGRLV